MIVIIGIILSLFETKEALKDKKIRAVLFILFMVMVFVLYIYQDKIPSIMNLIARIEELFYE